MIVNFENAIIARGGKGNPYHVINRGGVFRVYWCDKIKHYKIERIG